MGGILSAYLRAAPFSMHGLCHMQSTYEVRSNDVS